MPRVKCPHCGAGNQDATEQDTCWQCSNVLGSPVARTDTAAPPAVTVSEPTQQFTPEMLNRMTVPEQKTVLPAVQTPAPRPALSPLVLALAALLLIAIVIILVLALKH